jgi:hypothetical protein
MVRVSILVAFEYGSRNHKPAMRQGGIMPARFPITIVPGPSTNDPASFNPPNLPANPGDVISWLKIRAVSGNHWILEKAGGESRSTLTETALKSDMRSCFRANECGVADRTRFWAHCVAS